MDLMTIAKAAAESKFFPHITSTSRAFMVLLTGQEMGTGPSTALREIRYMDGRLVMQAGIISACIKRSEKYDYTVREHNNEECILGFVNKVSGDVLGESKFTMEDAGKADLLVSNKGNQTLNWKRYPRNMLFARALTNGARWFCPDVFGGSVYTQEELGDPGELDLRHQGDQAADGASDETDTESPSSDERKKIADAFAERIESSNAAAAAEKGEGSESEKAEPKPDAKTETPNSSGLGDAPSPTVRPEYLKQLDALCEKYSLGDIQKKAWCKHFKVSKIEDLTEEQIGKIIVMAEKKFGAAA